MNCERACLNCGTKYRAEPMERCCSQKCRHALEEKETRLEQLREAHSRLIDEEQKALDDLDLDTFEVLAAELARVRHEFAQIFGTILWNQLTPSANDVIH